MFVSGANILLIVLFLKLRKKIGLISVSKSVLSQIEIFQCVIQDQMNSQQQQEVDQAAEDLL